MSDTPQIRFDDGEGYEQMMGKWSRLAGSVFLDWVAPEHGLRWLDIGCGNGAFTELISSRCAPFTIDGIDPSEGQLSYARTRSSKLLANFVQGDAMALPYDDRSFDVAVMALVLFFVPEPARGVSEMARVVAPGGTVAAYAWDIRGGGFPLEPIQKELRAVDVTPMLPPSSDASKIESMKALWSEAGLVDIETRTIAVERTFADFEEYWSAAMRGSNVGQSIRTIPADKFARFEQALRKNTPVDKDGRITLSAWANAVKGKVAV